MNRPISTFVAIVAVLAAGLLALAWSGAAAPSVTAPMTGSGTYDQGRTGYLMAEITNSGALPVRVTEVRWVSEGLSGERLAMSTDGTSLEDMGPLEPFTLDGHERRTIMVLGSVHCPFPGDVVTVTTDPLEVDVRPAAGPTRTVTVRHRGLDETLPCPPRG